MTQVPWSSLAKFAAGPCPLVLLVASIAIAEPPADAPGRWKLETLTLVDGTEYRGVLLAEHTGEIEFAEILQPPGKPMYAVVRGIPRTEAVRLDVLDPKEHDILVARFASFRHRAVIEAGRMEQVRLREVTGDASAELLYEGPSFQLRSTAGDEATRRCVVRIEQMFRLYRTLLPPRVARPPRLTIELYGSLDRYRARLRELELTLQTAAFYSARERTIVAGSDLGPFIERLEETRRRHAEIKKTYENLEAQHAATLNELRGRLIAEEFSDAEVTAELRQRRATFEMQMREDLAASNRQQRSNERKFAEVTEQMFRRLAHEALHAWLDTHVYPLDQHDVPRWLNEGLAQVFESAQYDGDSLRVDAPDPERLAALQADLRRQPLPLARILLAEEREFLGPHSEQETQRHYLYAWGLTWHLAVHNNLLASPRLADYVERQSEPATPTLRFEKLTGVALAEFERRWHAALLDSKR